VPDPAVPGAAVGDAAVWALVDAVAVGETPEDRVSFEPDVPPVRRKIIRNEANKFHKCVH